MLTKLVNGYVSKSECRKVTVKRFIIVLLRGGRVQIFRNNLNKSKFYSGRNYEQNEDEEECLLSFGAESFVFQFVIN